MYAYNAWYVAAWGHEIDGKPLGRKLLDEPVVLFRGRNGRVAALEDRCCHRGTPLAEGEVVGDHIRCGYHGLVFDAAGRCVEIPGQPNIPTGARVRSFPVEEL
ncbi:MAG: Rieske 2Fe-2S domain-containing protein, partial [Candidatus Binataceae bacterium]